MLEEYAPPSVVVDARGEIRYYWGTNLSVFLPPRAGAPATNLMHLARRELRVELSAALHNAARQAKPVTYKDVVMEAEGVQRRLNLVVRPLRPTEQDPDELFLVVFEELQAAPVAHGTPLDAPTLERHRQLQRDLESTQERLQVTIEELENANEALRTSNEQLQSMNEEMHSSNEELQTSQEELQSVNEELNTLNAELSKKVDELELLYGDLQNLFQSTQIRDDLPRPRVPDRALHAGGDGGQPEDRRRRRREARNPRLTVEEDGRNLRALEEVLEVAVGQLELRPPSCSARRSGC